LDLVLAQVVPGVVVEIEVDTVVFLVAGALVMCPVAPRTKVSGSLTVVAGAIAVISVNESFGFEHEKGREFVIELFEGASHSIVSFLM
jgi:hypothetical protein